MSLALSEQQILLKDTAHKFFNEQAPVSALRKLRDECNPDGFCRDLWGRIVDMGWPGTCIPEQYGGLGYGFSELGLVLEAGGRTLAASPLFSNIVLSASSLLLGGSEEQKSQLLPRMARGELLLALALEEGPHHNPSSIATTATAQGDAYSLNGRKVFVIDGHVADQLIVVSRTAGDHNNEQGISLFLVNTQQQGVSIQRRIMVDSRNVADIHFDNVEVNRANLLGELHNGYPLLRQVIDRGNIGLAAEMLGSLQAAFDRTMDYIKQRQQFGKVIGSFQSLQHRAARMYCEIELSKSVVLAALQAIDEEADNIPQLASLAKVQVSDTFRLVGDEAIQMFGGVGMTDEEDIGFYLKRARVAQQTLGDENHHLQRYATCRGY